MNKLFLAVCRLSAISQSILIAGVVIFGITSCTHLPKPVEKIGQSAESYDWGKKAPEARDRARHTLSGPHPFEWWYFDGHLETGETFVGSFLDPSFTTGKPGVTFALYSPDWKKKSVSKSLREAEMKSSAEDVAVSCPLGSVQRLDDLNYRVQWTLDGLSADFKLTTTAPGWMPAGRDGVNQDDLYFFWNIHQARNRIEGTITQDGKTRQVKGMGYADHNWGRKALNEITRYWIWGRIFSDSYTIVFADVDYIDASIKSRPLYIAKGDTMIAGSGSPTIRQWDFVTHPVLKRHYPRQIRIDFADRDVQARLNIRFKALVENVDLLAAAAMNPLSRWFVGTFVFQPSYFRIIADYQGEIIEKGIVSEIKGECLYEIMGFE